MIACRFRVLCVLFTVRSKTTRYAFLMMCLCPCTLILSCPLASSHEHLISKRTAANEIPQKEIDRFFSYIEQYPHVREAVLNRLTGKLENVEPLSSSSGNNFALGASGVGSPKSPDPVLSNAAARAFEVPYRDSLGVVQNLIDQMHTCLESWQTCHDPEQQLYAPYMTVVQASMMGKTRMFFTLHRHDIFVFYICLRVEGCYPRGNPGLVNAMTNEGCTEGYYAAFLLSALETLHNFQLKPKVSESGETIFTEWFRVQQDPKFWKPIIGVEYLQFLVIVHS